MNPDEHATIGRDARARVRRSEHAGWKPPADREDPIEILIEQDASRVPELVPIRYGRMVESPFAFYRGSAAVMAADLGAMPSTGLRAQLCGDAHLANFGAFGSPDRRLVFDINDFDETLPGPFEWDVKRLAASIELASRARSFDKATCTNAVTAAVNEYQAAMLHFAQVRRVDIWYERLDEETMLLAIGKEASDAEIDRFRKTAQKARSKDNIRALERLTHRVNGSVQIVSSPPLVVPVEELYPKLEAAEVLNRAHHTLREYGNTLSGAAKRLIDEYHFVHLARKVVGVGSVGTRAWVTLLLGRDESDPLFLQLKEAGPSVLEPYAGKSRYNHHGRRVVEGQWLMQSASDIFLGWVRQTGPDGVTRDFYVRQLWDWKRSAELDTIRLEVLMGYVRMCGWTLAHAHARSGDPIAIGAYLGQGDGFTRAMRSFARAYADQAERDHKALQKAIKNGRVAAELGV